MNTVKTGKDFTGYVFGKCRNGHTSRFFVGKAFFNGWLELEDGSAVGILDAPECHVTLVNGFKVRQLLRKCTTDGCDRMLDLERCSPLFGRFVAEKVCNGKCLAATRAACECQCGGENHGKNHG